MKNSPTLAFVIAGWLFAAGIAPADTLTWTNLTGPGTNWTTAGNWTNGGGANAAPSTTSGSPDDVVFGYAATNTASFSLNNTAFYVNDLIATNAAYAFGTGTKILAAPGGSGGKLVMQAVGADLPSLAIRNDETNVLAQRNITITAPIELDADTVFQRLGTVSPNFARSVSFSGPISGGSPGVPLTVAFDNEDPGSFYRKLVIGGTNTFYATNVTLNGTIAMGSARAFGNPTNDIFTAGLRNTRVYTDFGGGTIDQDWHLTTNAFTTYLEATRQFAGGTNDFVFAGAFTGGRNGFNSLTFQATGENTFILTSTNQAFAGTATLTLDSEVIVAGANASALAWENANGVTMASGDRITGFSNERTALLLRGNYSLTQNVTIANATPANSGTNVNLLGQVNDGITAFDTRFTGKINVQETDYTAFGLFADTNGTARFEGNIFGTGGQGFLVNPSMNATSKLTLGVGEGLVVVASNAVVALTDGGSASIGTVRVLNGKFQVDTTNFFANVAVEGDALLQGNGRIRGNVTVSNTAAVGPGASIGSLGVDGDADINGTLRIEVNPAGAGAADFLNVTGLLDLAYATIDFDAFGPLDDLYYIFAEYGSLLGDDTVTLADLPAGYWVDFNYQGLNQIALVIPEPGAWFALAPAALALLAWRRRRKFQKEDRIPNGGPGRHEMKTQQSVSTICRPSLRDGGPAMDSSRGGSLPAIRRAKARGKSMACEAPRGAQVRLALSEAAVALPHSASGARQIRMDASHGGAETRRGTPNSSAYSAYSACSAVALLVALLFLAPPSRAVTIDLVTVGNPGNAPDPLNTNAVPGIGSVSYGYSIGKFEVFNSQYVDFLNAVADTDTYWLYYNDAYSDPMGGILQSGSSGSYTYTTRPGFDNRPVVYVSFYSAVRFANWLHNGQPTGAQGAGTTETGSYTLFTSGSSTTNVSARTPNATWVIPTENEWYKAAYYQPASEGGPSDSYWLYPMQTDSVPYSDQPPGTSSPDASRAANFYQDDGLANGYDDGYAGTGGTSRPYRANLSTDVGAYTTADSYYGTFDQGGNASELNETIISGSYQGVRGGAWRFSSEISLRSSGQGYTEPWRIGGNTGFRVAMIPEPGAFVALALVGLAGLAYRRRRTRTGRDAGPGVRSGHAPGPRGCGPSGDRDEDVSRENAKTPSLSAYSACSAVNSSRRGAEGTRSSFATFAYFVAVLVTLLFLAAHSRAVTIDLVAVGDPGNAPDPFNTHNWPGIGSVAYEYKIGKFEVQNSQYVEFLNAVAALGDTYGLYNTLEASPFFRGGITRGGDGTPEDPYTYTAKPNMDNKPVNFVSLYDAIRFVNWLANGQPTGTNQVAGTTETGSYTLFTNGSSTTNVSARAANATWVIPTENEWYKAAYYDPTASGTTNYWLYPTRSDSTPTVATASAIGNINNPGANVVNYNLGADWDGKDGNVTSVGTAGPDSSSYYGTYDQAGNVTEWTEDVPFPGFRRLRADNWAHVYPHPSSTISYWQPDGEDHHVGFRVGFMIPEPGGFVALAVAGLAGCVWRRWKRAGNSSCKPLTLALIVFAVVSVPLPSRAVTIDLVTVGDPGNVPDPLNTNSVPGIGSVSYGYSIGKFEVFNSQYVDFLNAVADTDTYGLYSTSMSSDARGGINRSGSSGSYTYAVKTGYDNMPVTFVSFYDAVRFANWIQNGQPTGAQGAGTTETGSYTLFTDGGTTTNVSARAANATWVIPTENEWYKAAYYDPTASGTTNYWLYPTQSDSIPNSRPPDGTDANSANFYRDAVPSGDGVNDGYAKTGSTTYESATNYLTDAGAYALAASYYGTFDQGGNVWEWNETLVGDSNRRLRGGSWLAAANSLRSTFLNDNLPTSESLVLGFRVAAIPEPGAWLALAPAALGLLARRRRRKLQKADKTPRQNEGENDMRTPTTRSGDKPGRTLGAPVSRPAKGSSHGDTEARRKSMARKAARSAQVPLAPPKAAAGLPHSEGGAAILIAFALLCLPTPGRPVTFQMVTVSNVNNAADSTGYGSVSYLYSMEMMEIANLHYTEFLNAVADTDTYGLYNTSMASDPRGGITRSGASGSYTYAVKTYMGAKPVNFVSYYDAVRFANWMANGQPTGGQTNGVTETGSYTLTGATSVGARDANATWVIPTENEWYKAAYYDPSASGPSDDYWLYPTRSDSVPTMGLVDAWGNIINDGPNVANYGTGADWNGQDGNVTSIGSTANNYPVGASYYGTLDQGGNVNEWTETILGSFRVLRGGGWANSEAALRATTQGFDSPTVEDVGLGFRLALIPEPGPIAAFGLLGLAAVAHRLRRRKKDFSHGDTEARRKSMACEAPRGAQVPLAPCKAAVALPHSESGAREVRMDASHGGAETRRGTPNSSAYSACSAVVLFLALLCLPAPSRAVTIDLVTVGDPGNAPDPLNMNSVPGIGSVSYAYAIGKYEVINSQYVDFLNAVADSDTYGLYNTSMNTDARGGITRSGSSGSYTYAVKSNMGDKPVNYVSFYDAVRFANWMAKGQPTGAQGAGTTETGSYTLYTSGLSTTNVSARADNALWVIPTENEWYKAAYYQPSGGGGPSDNYWLYPTQSDSVPTVGLVDATGSVTNDGPNVVNYAQGADWNGRDGNVTTVGSAGASSDSYYGTFDQGGNVLEWNEAISFSSRVQRGGSWVGDEYIFRSSFRDGNAPSSESGTVGFRLALIPEPGPIAAFGVVGLAAVACRLRRRKDHAGSGEPKRAGAPLAAARGYDVPEGADSSRRGAGAHGGSVSCKAGPSAYSACSAVALLVAMLFLAAPCRAVTIDLVTVGDPGNAPDPLNTNAVPGIGSVSYGYSIGKFEVFNSQYVEFLNAVADTDTYGLYNVDMASDARGGIVQSGSSGSYTYSVKSGYENMPVVYVSFYDAVRFANWLENGQPAGAQGAGTTETGSYTLFTSGSSTTNVSARAANATWAIPTENEWYKAAYYDPTASGTTNYWLYPTQSDSIPNSRPPNGTDANSANFYRDDASPDDFLNDGYAKTGFTGFQDGANYLTDVGSYTLADSYYGTFDQGGNVQEWNETIISGPYRGLRGNAWRFGETVLRSSFRGSSTPPSWDNYTGFRVAMIPEPGAFVALGLVGLVGWRFRKKSTGRRTGGPPPSDRDR